MSVTRDQKWSLFEQIANFFKNDKALTGSEELQLSKQIVVETTARHSDRAVGACSRTTVMKDLLFTCLCASSLSRSKSLSLLLVVSLASLHTNSEAAAIIDLLSIIYDPDLDIHLFRIEVKSIACFQNIFKLKVKKTMVLGCNLYLGFTTVALVASIGLCDKYFVKKTLQ